MSKAWSVTWSMAGVWLVHCGRIGDGRGREAGPVVFAQADELVARKVAAADEMLKIITGARHALISYQHGNGAPALADRYVELMDELLAKVEGRS